jgi:hypothetical protein
MLQTRMLGMNVGAAIGTTRWSVGRSGPLVALGAAIALTSGCWFDGRFEDVPASVCVSREIWTYTDKDSPLMNPGRSCVGCHAELNDPVHAPLYTVAGTVMADAHEDEDCRGVPEMTVVLTDADGTEWNMTGNSAGNFWLDPDVVVAMPYTARVIDREGNERIKQSPVSEGDCASCHTREGAEGAPGRILAPETLAAPETQ